MSKLMRMWVFLAVTGFMTACGGSPVDLAGGWLRRCAVPEQLL